MSMPFDATLKELARAYPADYLAAFDRPATQAVSLLNVDLSTVTAAADLVVGLGRPLEEIVHLDFQSSASATKYADVLVYNALLFGHYRVPVHSVVLLLRPSAAHSSLDGAVRYAARPGRGKMEFTYEVVRLWERPAEELLSGGPGTLPLAVLGRLPPGVDLQEGLTAVARRLIERLDQEASPGEAKQLLTAAFVLTGLRLKRQQARQVFMGVRAMRDSDTYMAIIDEGREQQAREDIFELGQEKFGPADASTVARLEGINDLDRLKKLIKHLLKASSWEELLDTP